MPWPNGHMVHSKESIVVLSSNILSAIDSSSWWDWQVLAGNGSGWVVVLRPQIKLRHSAAIMKQNCPSYPGRFDIKPYVTGQAPKVCATALQGTQFYAAVLRLQRSDLVNMLFLPVADIWECSLVELVYQFPMQGIGPSASSSYRAEGNRTNRTETKRRKKKKKWLVFWRLWIHITCIPESWGCHQMHVLGGQCASLTNCVGVCHE